MNNTQKKSKRIANLKEIEICNVNQHKAKREKLKKSISP